MVSASLENGQADLAKTFNIGTRLKADPWFRAPKTCEAKGHHSNEHNVSGIN